MARKKDEPSPAVPADRPPAPGTQEGQAPEAPQAMTDDLIAARLADPFPAAAVGWKPQTAKGGRALAVAYIDARDVMDRLDAVVGVAGWQDSYHENADGTVCCTLELRLGGEWLAKADVGGESEQKDAGDRKKAAYSDALKRAAVKWGVGRYLYSLPAVWADYDEQKRTFVRPPSLPAWALPGGSGRPPDVAPAQARTEAARPREGSERYDRPAAEAPPGPDFHRRLQEYDAKLAGQGLCKAGELVKEIAAAGKKLGYPTDMTQWGAEQIDVARAQTQHFEQQARAAAQPRQAG